MSITTPQNTKPVKTVDCVALEGLKGDYPIQITNRIQELSILLKLRKDFACKYRLYEPAFDVLFEIATKWMIEHKASTVWSLAVLRDDQPTAINYKVSRLLSKGLIEIAGQGKQQCRVYIPTLLAIDEIKRLVA